MTIRNSINIEMYWRQCCLEMTANSNVETVFAGSGMGQVLGQYEYIDPWSIFVFVQTAETAGAKTLNVGMLSTESGGNAAGILNGISIASTGWVQPTFTVSQGTNAAYISASTIGVLFKKGQDGANTAEHNAVPIYQGFIGNGTSKTLSYTCASSSTSFVGFLYFRKTYLPDLTSYLTFQA
jgi:hypothetical protein